MAKARAKGVLARNQDFLDRVIKENGRLVVLSETMKKNLADARAALSRTRADSLRALEPKLQQLLDGHKAELRSQSLEFERQLQDVSRPFAVEFELMRSDADAQIRQIETDCKAQLRRMKANALDEEKEMKDGLAAQLANAPSQIESCKAALVSTIQGERSIWQERRGLELRKEFETKYGADLRRLSEKQERLFSEVTSKLQVDAHEENRSLIEEETRNEVKHRKIEREVQSQISVAEEEIEEHRSQIERKKGEKQKLSERLGRCECQKLTQQLEQQRQQLFRLKTELEGQREKEAKEAKNKAAQEAELRASLQEIERDNLRLTGELDELKGSLERGRTAGQTQIEEADQRHRKELEVVGVRVRQTIERKDALIEQLMSGLDSLGAANDF
jgi:hypothetical protein